MRTQRQAQFDMRFDFAGLNGNPAKYFNQAQFDILNWTSPNGHYLEMSGDAHRSDVTGRGNFLVGYYNNFNDALFTSTPDANQAAQLINRYFNDPSTGTFKTQPATWVVLNEVNAGDWNGNSTYRTWVKNVVSALHNTYGLQVVTYSPESTRSSYSSDWVALSGNSYIATECYLGGTDLVNHNFSVSWAQSQYQAAKDAFVNAGVPISKLILGEHFGQSAAGSGYGREGVSFADWVRTIQVRDQAIYNVGFGGFMSYAWGYDTSTETEADMVYFEKAYRSSQVVSTEQRQWINDGDGSWGPDTWTGSSGTFTIDINWIGGMPTAGQAANFLGAITSPATVTLDGNRSAGSLTFDNPNTYTIAEGTGGTLTLDGIVSAAGITVVQGTHIISAPVILNDLLTVNATGAIQFTGSFTDTGSHAITKLGTGSLTMAGTQTYGIGSTLNANAGTTILNSDAGGPSVRNLSINANAIVSFNSPQHLAALNVGSSGAVTAGAGGSNMLVADGLSVAGTGKLDLNDNDLVVNNGDFSTIQNLVFAGYRDHIDTAATGIVSSTSQATGGNTILILFDNSMAGATDWPAGSGQTIGSNAVVGKYTYFGDTNLDGQVTGDDYGAIDANLGTTGINPGIAALMGDTNFDGNITGDDYAAVDGNLGLGVGSPLDAAAVPEPRLGTLAFGLAWALISRRRRHGDPNGLGITSG